MNNWFEVIENEKKKKKKKSWQPNISICWELKHGHGFYLQPP
jgi:hypothetical protein